MTISAALAIALQAIPIVEKLTAFINKTFARAKAAGEMTPEAEAAYQVHQATVLASAVAQIEPDPE